MDGSNLRVKFVFINNVITCICKQKSVRLKLVVLISAKPGDYPYFVRRTKSHMIPVYLERTHRGQRRITKIRMIEGDIWAFTDELKAYLEKENNMRLIFQINEFAQFVKIKTDVVTLVRKWLYDKGF